MRSHSSMSHRSMSSRRSSLSHRSNLSKMHKGIGHTSGIRSHSSAFKHHGISDAHAFNVARATGVNINASAMGAHGAALYRARRRNSTFKNSTSNYRRNSTIRKIRFSHNDTSFKSKKYHYSTNNKFDGFDEFQESIEENYNNLSKFIWIPFLIFIIAFAGMIIFFMFFSRMLFRF